MPLDTIYQYFETYRKATSDYEVFSAKGCEAGETDICPFEDRIGFRLPDEFRDFSKSYLGGIYMAAKESIWPRPKAGDVGPYWSFMYGFIVFGFSKEAPEIIDIRARLDEFEAIFGKIGFVPFMMLIGSADRFCFDSSGQIVEFSHEEIDNPKVLGISFSDLLMKEIRDLEERTEQKKKGE